MSKSTKSQNVQKVKEYKRSKSKKGLKVQKVKEYIRSKSTKGQRVEEYKSIRVQDYVQNFPTHP